MIRSAEDLLQELSSLDESQRIEAKRGAQIDRSVTFESSRRPDQFVATFLFHHLLGADDLAWLRRLTSEALSDEEARALVFVRELGAIDNAAYRAINRTDTLNASAHLRRLRDLDLLEMKGSGSRTYYVSGPAFFAGLSVAEGNTPQAPINTHQPVENTHQHTADSHRSELTPPDALMARIRAAGSKPRRNVLRAVILDLCAWQPCSARALAHWLGRSDHKHLVREHLTPMVRSQDLAYTIPEMENHPEQRYTVPTAPTTD